MVDLHSHVLYSIDDGAESMDDSLKILEKAERMGIKKMIATPHFTIGDSVEDFLKIRNRKLEKLKAACEENDISVQLKAGAEVYITDELFNESELEKLTLGDSNVLLAEFKYHSLKPETFLEYIDEIQSKGIDVLVAHPERYSYLLGNKFLLDALLSRRVLLQVNAISLFEDSPQGDFATFLVKNKLAYAIGSDIHHVSSKRLNAMGKMNEVKKDYIQDMLSHNPDKIFEKAKELS